MPDIDQLVYPFSDRLIRTIILFVNLFFMVHTLRTKSKRLRPDCSLVWAFAVRIMPWWLSSPVTALEYIANLMLTAGQESNKTCFKHTRYACTFYYLYYRKILFPFLREAIPETTFPTSHSRIGQSSILEWALAWEVWSSIWILSEGIKSPWNSIPRSGVCSIILRSTIGLVWSCIQRHHPWVHMKKHSKKHGMNHHYEKHS